MPHTEGLTLMYSIEYRRLLRNFGTARIINFFGSAFSEFSVPLFLYNKGSHPIHIAMQWAVLASARFLSGYLSPRITIWKKDTSGIIWIDILQGIAVLLPVILYDRSPLLGSYLCTLILASLSTIQQGYIGSLIVNASKQEKDSIAAQQRLNSILESGRHAGMLSGFILAFLLSSYFGFKVAFLIDSATFFASAWLLKTTPTEHFEKPHSPESVAPLTYSLLFMPHIRWLTISQLLLSFAGFFYNGSYIVHLKRDLASPDSAITSLFILQYLAYAGASFLSAQYKEFPIRLHLMIRSCFVPIYLLFAWSPTFHGFIFANTVYSFLLGWSQPNIITLFQKSAPAKQQRGLATARTALVSIIGAVGAMLAGIMLNSHGAKVIFLLATAVCILSWVAFVHYYNSTQRIVLVDQEQ